MMASYDKFVITSEMIAIFHRHSIATFSIVTTLVSWLIWRLWRFTIQPLLRPDEPEELPYSVPFIGHGVAFFRDSNLLLARAKDQVGQGTEPFALTVFGETFYVVANAKQSADVYRDVESLSFDGFVQSLMKKNGSDEKTINSIFAPLSKEKSGFPNPDGLSLGALAGKMHTQQLHPGPNMMNLQRVGADWINSRLRLDALAKDCSYAITSPGRIEVPLYHWTSDYFVRLGQHVYFGDPLHQIDPDYSSAFIVFDEVIWKMLYQYPDIFCRDMTRPRDQMLESMKRYFQIPKGQRQDHAAWIVNAMEDEMRACGMDDKNVAIMVFHLYLGLNTNARKTSFWLLTHLMHHPKYLEAFRTETAPAFRGDELVDLNYIQDPTKCPTVDAVWNETLRLAGWAASVRRVARDTVIGGKRLRTGNRVMVAHRLLHFDDAIFGMDVTAWRPERWLEARGSKLQQSQSWRPFGGGKTKCSGRFLARYFVTSFTAALLRRFDIQAVGNLPTPEPDVGRPVLGIISVKEGQDYSVSLTPRGRT
ncbi:putative cytochrome P450 [Xylariaceae sp. FL1019]|nr:putative cytochrome P450 [Xylariaceae sp. FL1019]